MELSNEIMSKPPAGLPECKNRPYLKNKIKESFVCTVKDVNITWNFNPSYAIDSTSWYSSCREGEMW